MHRTSRKCLVTLTNFVYESAFQKIYNFRPYTRRTYYHVSLKYDLWKSKVVSVGFVEIYFTKKDSVSLILKKFKQNFQLEFLTRIDTEFQHWHIQGRRDSVPVKVIKIVSPKTLLIIIYACLPVFVSICIYVITKYNYISV